MPKPVSDQDMIEELKKDVSERMQLLVDLSQRLEETIRVPMPHGVDSQDVYISYSEWEDSDSWMNSGC